MLRSPPILPAMLVSALLLGCGEQSAPSEPATTPGPSLRTAQNPDGPGAFVIRSQDIVGFLFIFEDPALTVLTGLTLDQLDVLCSGGEPVFEPADVQLVSLPRGSGHVVFKARDFTVLVFEGLFADFCAVPPFAVGEGDFTSTNGSPFESRFAFIESTLRALVSEQTGEQHHLLIRYHALFDRSTGESRELVNDIDFN